MAIFDPPHPWQHPTPMTVTTSTWLNFYPAHLPEIDAPEESRMVRRMRKMVTR